MQNKNQNQAAKIAQKRVPHKRIADSDKEFQKLKESHNALLNNNPYLKNMVSSLIEHL